MKYGKRILGVIMTVALFAGVITMGSSSHVGADMTTDDAMYVGQVTTLNTLVGNAMAYGGEHSSQAMSDPEVQAKIIAGFYMWQYVDDVFDTLEPTEPFEDSHVAYGMALDLLNEAAPTCIYAMSTFDVASLESCTASVTEASGYIQLSTELIPASI